MSTIKGNRGEWSEKYTFLQLLSTGRIYAADEQLNRIENMFFPIIKILREETRGQSVEYYPGEIVRIYLNDSLVSELPSTILAKEAARVYQAIIDHGHASPSFSIQDTEMFMKSIFLSKLKAPSTDKADISMQTRDIHTGFERIVGFSIKSELGHPPTLLNAGRTTNFIYRVDGLHASKIASINAIETTHKIRDRVDAIMTEGGKLVFSKLENDVFAENLMMIDSQMAVVVAEMLLAFYSGTMKTCHDLLSHITKTDPISRSPQFYSYKLKELLCAVALGMKPASPWNGMDEASGGYIVVKSDGEVLAFHIYNRDSFKEYLLHNTRLESASTSRHGYATLYEEEKQIFIKLNLQIRFS